MSRLRHPQTTVRWRLTLLYGGLFLVSGALLLTITYTLVARNTVSDLSVPFVKSIATGPVSPAQRSVTALSTQSIVRPVPPQLRRLLRSQSGRFAVRFVGAKQRVSDLHHLIVESAIALAITALISTGLGWLVAGRVLRPIRTMTRTAQQMSAADLDQRLAMAGPRDELRELAATIDELLGRLQAAFDAQRRFVANASHELRTPLTAVRALLELVLSDPRADLETFRAACRQVLEENEEQEELIDALLGLAQGQRGIHQLEPIDLAAVVSDVLPAARARATQRGLELTTTAERAPIAGDRRLVTRMVANLLDNAVRHNRPGGRVEVDVGGSDGRPGLRIANTGPLVPGDEIERLLLPFQRMAAERTGMGSGDGVGLGLSIVAAIAAAHGATLDVRPGPDGGLSVEVAFTRLTADGVPDAHPGSECGGQPEQAPGRSLVRR